MRLIGLFLRQFWLQCIVVFPQCAPIRNKILPTIYILSNKFTERDLRTVKGISARIVNYRYLIDIEFNIIISNTKKLLAAFISHDSNLQRFPPTKY